MSRATFGGCSAHLAYLVHKSGCKTSTFYTEQAFYVTHLDFTSMQLACKCDVLVENFIPGKLANMGLGYEQLKDSAPHLIYASITGKIS